MRKTVYFKNGTKIRVREEDANLLIKGKNDPYRKTSMCTLYKPGYVLIKDKLEVSTEYCSCFEIDEILAIY